MTFHIEVFMMSGWSEGCERAHFLRSFRAGLAARNDEQQRKARGGLPAI